MNHREESKTVKDALSAAGIKARVGHGKGTAWNWLHIKIDLPENCSENYWRELWPIAEKIAQAVTGRRGEYGGEINLYSN
jgi:hypothetical protein